MFELVEDVANTSPESVEVWFEPWGIPHSLPPGEAFRIVVVSEQEGRLEIERSPAGIAVYAWPRCTMKVFRGDELIEDFSVTIPELPPGMSTREFIGHMFGGPGGPKPA